MSFRTRLLILLLALLLLAVLDALFSPFLVAQGIRRWLEWAARQEGLVAEVGRIEAPFLAPVKISELHLRSSDETSPNIDVHLRNLSADLNFRARVLGRSAPFIHSLEVEGLAAAAQAAQGKGSSKPLDWRQFARLVPANFRIDQADIRVTTPNTTVACEGLSIVASAVESGKFSTRRLAITSPLLRRTFVDLQGATSWENERLTIAGIPLLRGLDLEALAIDFSRLERRRLGIDLHLDAYGGTLRASVQGRSGVKFGLEMAGSASNLSLAQISRAMGFVEPISGSIRASKFTFRGTPGESLDATASIWMELTGFAWRARRADNVMLGATYYDRRLEVDQLYVRQHKNELTINGEMRWPNEHDHWAQLPFRGQVNATIPDLNRFAELFGATTGDFTGALLARGDIDSLVSPPHGQLSLEGKGVSYRGVTLDSLGAELALKGNELALTKLEARHAEDFLHGQGSIALSSEHRFDGRLTGALNDIGTYTTSLPAKWQEAKIAGGVTFDWQGDGTFAAHSGTVQLSGHGLQLPLGFLRAPLDMTVEGSYSPRDVFFRTFQLATDRISLGGFLMLGDNFIELQALQLALDGVPRVTGTLFLPLGLDRWRNTGSFLAALDETQKFDLDLAINQLDLAGLTTALGEPIAASGVLSGKLAGFGPLGALQLTTHCSLENFGGASPKNRLDFDARYADGRADGVASAFFGNSAPIRARFSLPVRPEKNRLADGKIFDHQAGFYCTVDCPALWLETLPRNWRLNALSGILTGGVAFSDTLAAPKITGGAQLLDALVKPTPPWPEVNQLFGQFRFTDSAAVIEALRGRVDGLSLAWNGRLTTAFPAFRMRVSPLDNGLAVVAAPPNGSDLATVRLIGEGTPGEKPRLNELMVSGEFGSPSFSLTTTTESASDPSLWQQSTSFVHRRPRDPSPLLLQVARPKSGSAIQLAPSR
jgi:hypothetical protein